MKVDVACLQETHAPSHESIRKWFANSGFRVVSSSISNKRCGTAILVRDSLKVTKVITDDAGRFVQALVDFGEDQLSFISLYAPNRNPERNAFFASLTGLIDLTRPVFVAGDFNSVFDNLLDRKRRPSFAGGESARQQESGPALQSLLSFTPTYPLWRTMRYNPFLKLEMLLPFLNSVPYNRSYVALPYMKPEAHRFVPAVNGLRRVKPPPPSF